MLSRINLDSLGQAITSLTRVDENEKKLGLKLHFRDAYDHRSKALFPKARHTCVKNSFEKTRRPVNPCFNFLGSISSGRYTDGSNESLATE